MVHKRKTGGGFRAYLAVNDKNEVRRLHVSRTVSAQEQRLFPALRDGERWLYVGQWRDVRKNVSILITGRMALIHFKAAEPFIPGKPSFSQTATVDLPHDGGLTDALIVLMGFFGGDLKCDDPDRETFRERGAVKIGCSAVFREEDPAD